MRTNRPMTAAEEMGLGPKKTALVLFTVVGCIAILFPKIFYPMLMGPSATKDRGPSNLLKQERPTHVNELVYPSMLERGRAIPPHTVPIVERPGFPGGLPQRPGHIERRPGSPLVQGHPGPSMRAASFQAQQQQQSQKGQSQSIIMPIYTFGIVAFFVFTIVKIIMKKVDKKKPKPLESDPVFVDKVFKQSEPDPKKKLVYTAIQGIIDATNDQLKEIEKDCAMNNDEHFNHTNVKKSESEDEKPSGEKPVEGEAETEPVVSDELMKIDSDEEKENAKKAEPTEHDLEVEKRIGNLREALHIRAVENDENSDLKSIYLEGELPHDPQILVSATETETKTGRVSSYNKDVADDEAVILSGKMTISLISLSNNDEDGENGVVEDHTTTNNVA